jgi:hypothetical protein
MLSACQGLSVIHRLRARLKDSLATNCPIAEAGYGNRLLSFTMLDPLCAKSGRRHFICKIDGRQWTRSNYMPAHNQPVE